MAKASALRDLTVSELERVLTAKKSKLEDLVAKRDKLRVELNHLDDQIRGLAGGSLPDDDGPRRRGRPKGAKGRKRRGARVKGQDSLKVWVTNELAKSKKGLTIDELISNVQAAGYRTTSDKFKNVMYQCLFHNESFQRDSDSKRWILVAN